MVRSHPSAPRLMLNTIITDFTRVLLLPKDSSYTGKLNRLHKELSEKDPHYPFFDHFVLNEELLNYYKNMKTSTPLNKLSRSEAKFSLHIFTTGTIQDHPEVRKIIDPIFDNIFSAEEFSLHKNAPHAYTFIARKINKSPNEIIFVDDKRQNLEAAEKVGVTTILYRGNEKLFDTFYTFLQSPVK